MQRSHILLTLALSTCAVAQDTHFGPLSQQFPNPPCLELTAAQPCTVQDHALWLKDLEHWRMERRLRIGFDPARYASPALAWTHSSYMQTQMMVQDRFFYDPVKGVYTVDRYLDDLKARYGGIDAVLIWPPYPNMGIDNRNQLDMVTAMPGGLAGVKAMVADFHRRNVRVLFPMMMWDQGTRAPGQPWPESIAAQMKEIGADGVNGDTQDGVPLAFSVAAEKIGHPLAFQPELNPHDEALAWDVMNWGQYRFPFVPLVDRYKWIEPRHMVNISDRWNHDKNNDLQYAFFNGVGWECWENIWGIWNGITPRDSEATRRVATIERGVAAFLVSPGWEPYYPVAQPGVFASRWPAENGTVWTLVNRNEKDFDAVQIPIPVAMGTRFFDLYHGVELKAMQQDGAWLPSVPLEAHGFGAVLATSGEPSAAIEGLMATMHTMTARPLASYDGVWKFLPQTLVPIAATRPAKRAPEGMVKIPGGNFRFKVQGIEIEGKSDVGVDVQYPWETSPNRSHDHRMEIKPFYVDKFPVTNQQFKRFMDASHYQPTDNQNFLRDWRDGTFPAGSENRPVTWVSLEDARAYAAWAGKRLPHEWEWQYAAQGTDERAYPWGNTWIAENVPEQDQGREMRLPDQVDAHPAGVSPFGVKDLVGNVWQWTEEFEDEHTRAAILRGGSFYKPQGSNWYFPQAYRNDQHGKLLLMAPSYDRAATVGFRCAQDAE